MANILAYEAITQDMQRKIESAIYQPGERLPSESLLAEKYGVSRMTVRHALSVLASKNLIVRRHGSGTFVSEKPEMHRQVGRLGSFHEDLGVPKGQVKTQVLEIKHIAADEFMAEKLQVKIGHGVMQILRARTIHEKVVAIQKSFLPYLIGATVTGSDTYKTSLYEALEEEAGIRIEYANQQIRAHVPESFVSTRLGIEPGMPVLKLTRISYTSEDKPIEYAQSWTHPDLPFHMRIER